MAEIIHPKDKCNFISKILERTYDKGALYLGNIHAASS